VNFEDFKNLVKDRTDLAAVIGKHTKLVRTPRGFKACCPLPGHKEKTPSFNIEKQKNLYYCYGCNRGGDAFKFLEVVEGLSFFEALKELAQQANLEIPKNLFKDSGTSQVQKGRLELGYDVLDRAAKYFTRVLQSSSGGSSDKVLEYLDKRGIALSEIEELGLGWSPEDGNALSGKIRESAEIEVALATGLIRESGTRRYDFFRGRLMIPIHDYRGRVIGFSGRTLEADVPNKYVNSVESDWFKKKTVLYGLDRASKFIREEGFVCVVEGYFDQWALHRLEIPAVAVMGTALGEDHLTRLTRYTNNVILVMDGDRAGIESTKKSLPLFVKNSWDVRVFQGFAGKDPDEWLKENPRKKSEVLSLMRGAPEGFLWLVQITLSEAAEQKLNRSQILKTCQDLWAMAANESHKAALLDSLEPVLGVNYDRKATRLAFERGLQTLQQSQQKQQANSNMRAVPGAKDTMSSSATSPFQRQLVQQAYPSKLQTRQGSTLDRTCHEAIVWWLWHWDVLTPKNEEEWLQRKALFEGTLAGSWVDFCIKNSATIETTLTLEELSRVLDQGELEPELLNVIYRGLVKPEGEEQRDSSKVLNSFRELCRIVEREKVMMQISALRGELQNSGPDAEKTARLLRGVQDLSLHLEKIK